MLGAYVHHHGAGHVQRFLALRAELDDELVGLSSAPRPDALPRHAWIDLPHDATQPDPLDPTAGGALHWAPLREPGMTARTARIASWVHDKAPSAMVIDVSVEAALTARLLGVPTVVVAQHGQRDDEPHRLAYRSAAAVAALWPAGAAPVPPAAEGKVHHVGWISRFDGRAPGPPPAPAPDGRRTVLLLVGRGGHAIAPDDLAGARRATADRWSWEVLGDPALGGVHASPEDVWRALGRASVVVGPASNNCVAEAAAARRPLVVLPQARPFDEQRSHAAMLESLGLAAVAWAWPGPGAWPDLLEAAHARGGSVWAGRHDGGGAARLARVVQSVAGR